VEEREFEPPASYEQVRSHPRLKGGLLLRLCYFWVDWASIFSMTMALEPPRL